MDQIHGVERDASKLDDGIVAAGQKKQGNHVDDSHNTGAVADLASDGGIVLLPVDAPDGKSNIGAEVAQE